MAIFFAGSGFLLYSDIWRHYQNKLEQFKPPAGKSGFSVFRTAELQIWEEELGLPTTQHGNRFATLVLQIHTATNVISDWVKDVHPQHGLHKRKRRNNCSNEFALHFQAVTAWSTNTSKEACCRIHSTPPLLPCGILVSVAKRIALYSVFQ